MNIIISGGVEQKQQKLQFYKSNIRLCFGNDISEKSDSSEMSRNEGKGVKSMSSNSNGNNRIVVPAAREAMNKFKMEAANEVGVNLKQGYNGDLTSRQAGSIGGQMVRKMIEAYENGLK